jgi:hypothetical protein
MARPFKTFSVVRKDTRNYGGDAVAGKAEAGASARPGDEENLGRRQATGRHMALRTRQ